MPSLELVRPAPVVVPRRVPSPPPPTGTTSGERREARAVFVGTAVGFLVLGLWLSLREHLVLVDALARVGNASYVVTGRQPHLAAIGFVWNPLPSLAMVPLVALRGLVPALVELGLAATVTTALAMAGAVHQLHGLLLDARAPRPLRLAATALLVVHPMVLFYAGNGMSEAWLLLALAWAARRLARWLRTQRTADLVSCGIALAVGYLARYEAIAAAAAVPAVVAVHSWRRATGDARRRRLLALNDVVLVALPAAVAVLGWMVLSWVIVGHPFETFQSPYGNSAQVELAGSWIAGTTGAGTAARVAYVGEQVAWLAPALALVVPLSLLAGVTRRGRPLVAPLAAFGSVLVFQAAAFVHGDTFGWLRFSICAVPLGAVLPALLATLPRARAPRLVAALLATSLAATGAIAAWHPVLDPRLGREEAAVLVPLLQPDRATPAQRAALHRFENERALARWLDAQRLPEASVLVDTAPGFAIVVASRRPKQFVITSDQDFQAAVADPAVYDVRLMLVQPTPQDALNIAYPGIYDEGRPFVRLVAEFPDRGVGVPWRVYEVTERF